MTLRQTRFLAATFAGYESRRTALGAHDEHTLRALVSSSPLARPYRTLVVAVADHPRDANGLWSADFDLLTRLDGVEDVAVVSTEAMLATGWFERLMDRIPMPIASASASSIPARRRCRWCAARPMRARA